MKYSSFLLHEKRASIKCLVDMSSFNPQTPFIRAGSHWLCLKARKLELRDIHQLAEGPLAPQ